MLFMRIRIFTFNSALIEEQDAHMLNIINNIIGIILIFMNLKLFL
jgi:hypothetical protein